MEESSMKKNLRITITGGAALIVALVFISGCSKNELPLINSLLPFPVSDTLVISGDSVVIKCSASDANGDKLNYLWTAQASKFVSSSNSPEVIWVAPSKSGIYQIKCSVYETGKDPKMDTFAVVSKTLNITVQNYFPMSLGNWWHYEAPAIGGNATMDIKITSKEELANGKTRWHILKTYTLPTATLPQDSFSYFTVKKDSVWFFDAPINLEYLTFHFPLYQKKQWNTGEGGLGKVNSIKDRGTEAGNFLNCVEVDINLKSKNKNRTCWVAPDVGVIVNETMVLQFLLKFELVSYGKKTG